MCWTLCRGSQCLTLSSLSTWGGGGVCTRGEGLGAQPEPPPRLHPTTVSRGGMTIPVLPSRCTA